VTNVLRYDCDIAAWWATSVWVQWAAFGGGFGVETPTCGGKGESEHRAPGMFDDVTIYGLCPEKSFWWRPVASNADGTSYGYWRNDTTGALPDAMDNIVVDIEGTPAATEAVLLNYGCDSVGDQENNDWLVVLDKHGFVRWYQDPAAAIGATLTTEFTIDAVGNPLWGTVLFILDHDYLVEMDYEGTVSHVYCRDACSAESEFAGDCDFGSCVDPGVTPDATWDSGTYVHHDILRADNRIYALSAESIDVPDVEDPAAPICATLPETTYPIVVDGVIAFDRSSNLQVVNWELDEVYDVAYTDDRCRGPTRCGAGSYWDGLLAGCDWAHTNSLWIDAADQWLFSYKNPDIVASIDMSVSPAVEDWSLCAAAGACTYDLGSVEFSEQHAAMWSEEDPDRMLLFDNEAGASTGGDSRALVIDWSSGSPAVDAAMDMVRTDGSTTAECTTGGSVLDISGTELAVGFCAKFAPTATASPLVNEFNYNTGARNWAMEVSCDSSVSRTRAGYRGYPVSLWEPCVGYCL
jgi:hypothetical protein